MTDIPWLAEADAPTWHEMCTLYEWTPRTHAINTYSQNHAHHLIETADITPLRELPSGIRQWYICCLKAGVAEALAIHEPEPFATELHKVSRLWAHLAALSVGMVDRILTDLGPSTDTDDPDQPPT